MQTKAKDKRIKALNQVPITVPDEDLSIVGLRPLDAALIRYVIAELNAFPNLSAAGTAHAEWRLHHWAPKRASDPWSIDVSGNWRLLFEYNKKTHEITGLRLNPH